MGLKLLLFNIRYSQSRLLSKKGDGKEPDRGKTVIARGFSPVAIHKENAGLLRRGSQ
jgi:hypothetical protein